MNVDYGVKSQIYRGLATMFAIYNTPRGQAAMIDRKRDIKTCNADIRREYAPYFLTFCILHILYFTIIILTDVTSVLPCVKISLNLICLLLCLASISNIYILCSLWR